MFPTRLCSLCISTCNTFKSLYSDDGQLNEIYHMAVQYFDPMLLRPGKHRSSVICTECWQHIIDFHTFQRTVISTQSQLEFVEPIVHLTKLEDQLKIKIILSSKKSSIEENDKVLLKETRTVTYDSERQKNDAFIAKFMGMLECLACHEVFESHSLLSNHFRVKHPQKECHIYCCKLKFNKRHKLLAHVRRFHNQREKYGAYECELCTESFSQSIFLTRHYRHVHKHTDRYSYKCDICGRPFAQAFRLKKHIILKHKGQASPQWFCQLCNRKYKFQLNFKKHKEQVHSNVELNSEIQIKNEPSEEALYGREESYNHNDDKIHENEIPINVELKSFITSENQSDESKNKIVFNSIVSNKDNNEIYDIMLADKLVNENQTIDITDHNQFQSSSEYPQNVILKSTQIRRTHKELRKENETPQITFKQELVNSDVSQESEYKNITISQEIPSGSMATSDQIQLKALDILDIKSEMDSTPNSELDSEKIVNMEADFQAITSTRNKHLNPFLYDDFISKWKGDLECPECKAIFAKYSLLGEHFRLNHPKERCYIICCKIFLIKINAIVEHIRTHIDPKVYQCDICGRSYKKGQSLAQHKNKVHTDLRSTDRRYLCNCNKAMELYAKMETFNIAAPTSSLNTRDSLNNGIQCCQRNQKILENDEIIAKWHPQLDCRICKEKFSYFSLLRAHFYYKHPQKKCYIICCKRNFFNTFDAVDHIRVHLDPNAFKCDLCNIPLSSKSCLKRHMRGMHGETRKWKCDKCNKKYSHLQTLKKHIKSEHPNLKSNT